MTHSRRGISHFLISPKTLADRRSEWTRQGKSPPLSLPVIGHDRKFWNLWPWHLQKNLELRPVQEVIVAIGFSETDRVKVREAQSLGAGAYIKKPYILEKIGVAVKEELEK